MTTGIVLDKEFLPKLDEKLHQEPHVNHVFDQFVMERQDFTKGPGEELYVNGPTWLTGVTSAKTQRKLASIASRVTDNAVQTLAENQQALTMTERLLENPVSIREYEKRHAFHSIPEIVGGLLATDYQNWRDCLIRDLMLDSTYRQYAGSGNTSFDNLEATDLFEMKDFLKAKATLSQGRNIPSFPDGTYICIIDEYTQATLFVDQKLLDFTSRALASQAWVLRGEIGTFSKIRFVVSNNIGTVTSGASGNQHQASQAIMFGTSLWDMFPLGTAEGMISGPKIDYLRGMGAGPVVKIEGMPVEARFREDSDYGRFDEVIWIEHSGYSVVDPNPGGGKTKGVDTRFIQNLRGATILGQ